MFEPRTPQSEVIGFRLTPDERRALEQYATQHKLSLSEFIRLAIGEMIHRDKLETRSPNGQTNSQCGDSSDFQSMKTSSDSEPEREQESQNVQQAAGVVL